MIALSVAERVAELLANGLTQRRIAATVGVSRGTIVRISRGYRPQRHERHVEPDSFNTGPVERCPQCGDLVHVPCVKCRALAYLAAKGGAA